MTQNRAVVCQAGVSNAVFQKVDDAWGKLRAAAQEKLTPFLSEFGHVDDAFVTASPNPSGLCPKLNHIASEATLSPATTKLLEIFLLAAGEEPNNIEWLQGHFSNLAARALDEAAGDGASGITAEQLLQAIELRFETDTQKYSSGSRACDSSDDTYESKARLVAFLKEGNPWNLPEKALGALPEVRSAFGNFAEVQGAMGPLTWEGTQQTPADIFHVSGENQSWRKDLALGEEEFQQLKPQAAKLMMESIRKLLDQVSQRRAVSVEKIDW